MLGEALIILDQDITAILGIAFRKKNILEIAKETEQEQRIVPFSHHDQLRLFQVLVHGSYRSH